MVYRLITGIFVCLSMLASGQPVVVDEIVAVVGDNYILRSDIDKEFETYKEQVDESQEEISDSIRVLILDRLIAKKILLYKAQLDSFVLNEERVDAEMDRKISYVIGHFGGDEKALENYLGMSIPEFKEKTREKLREQLLVEEMENEIISSVKVTPSEVRKYYNSIPKDSLDPIQAEVEVAQLVILPKVSEEAKLYAYEKAKEIRARIVDGQDFCFLAETYSDDPSSSGNCGSLGFFTRGKMVAEFEAAAFRLQKDSISRIIESQYGYHIIKLVERRGESVHVQHILISPRIVNSDVYRSSQKLDSILQLINSGQMTFEEAATKFSDDEMTKSTGGRLTDYSSGSTRLYISMLDKETYMAIKDLTPGEISSPKLIHTPDGKQAYIIYHLISETEAHAPDLERDYLKIQAAALNFKKAEALEAWYAKNEKEYFISINPRYSKEPMLAHWIKK